MIFRNEQISREKQNFKKWLEFNIQHLKLDEQGVFFFQDCSRKYKRNKL